jgi:P27 family predicted phage terminase small subunit
MRRKSKEEKQQQGTYRADRDRKTPKFSPGAVCPKYLTKTAKAEWNRVAPLLEEAGILRDIDASLLASYCQMFAHWRSSEDAIAKNGLVVTVSSQTRTGRTDKPVQNPAVRNSIQFHKAMMATAVKLGISPLDRPRIEVPPDEEDVDPFALFNSNLEDYGIESEQ